MIMVSLLFAAALPPVLAGDWDGALTVPAGIEVPLVLHLKDGQSTLDSPDQNASGVPVETALTSRGVTIDLPSTGSVSRLARAAIEAQPA